MYELSSLLRKKMKCRTVTVGHFGTLTNISRKKKCTSVISLLRRHVAIYSSSSL